MDLSADKCRRVFLIREEVSEDSWGNARGLPRTEGDKSLRLSQD